jgi:hypothetical protein
VDMGAPAGAGLAGPDRAAAVARARADVAAGRTRRARLPDRRAGHGRRRPRQLLLLDAVPVRVPAAVHAAVLVLAFRAQPGRRVPRRAEHQRTDRRAAAAARLPDRPQARAQPRPGLQRGDGHRAAAGRPVLHRVRDDRRDLPGARAGLAAQYAHLADRPDGAHVLSRRRRIRAAGRLPVGRALARAGDRGRVPGGGVAGVDTLHRAPRNAHRRRRRPAGERPALLAAEQVPGQPDVPRRRAQPVR